MNDLSQLHCPIAPPETSTARPAAGAALRLTQTQQRHFQEQGFVTGIRVLDLPQVERLRAELAELAGPRRPEHALFHEYHSNESGREDQVLFHALGAWRIAVGFHDLLYNPAIEGPARQLLGGPVRFWHDQLFAKPAHDGGIVAWHQDYSYWTRTGPMNHLTCFLALDDCEVENGCLHYVPGSHRWDLLPITGLAQDMSAIDAVLDESQKAAFRPVPVELAAGEASFHHPLMVHGSYENRSPRPRRAAVLNLCRDGTRSRTDEALLDGVPPIPSGQPLSGRFFPRLSGPDADSEATPPR